jgi:simple sugar transport system permease protein
MISPEGKKGAVLKRLGVLTVTMACAFAVAVGLLLAFSSSFGEALGLFFLGPFKNAYYFGNMLNDSIAFALTGLGVSVAFASKNFNLGGEGQVYSGAIATVAVCLAFPEGGLPALVLAVLAGMAVGGLLGGFSGYLKRALAVDELISSFLASAAVVLIGDYVITGPLQDPASNFQTTLQIADAFKLSRILPPSSLSTGCFIAIAASLVMKLALDKTRFGFELRLCGSSREFARYVGVDTGFFDIAPMVISGALHGLAGAVMILGTYYKAMRGFSAGVGWAGIAVALIAGNKPLAVLPAALFFAYLEAGAKAVMVGADVTSEIVAVVQSVIFFLITARVLEGLFQKKRTPSATSGHTASTAVLRDGGSR